MRKLLKKRESIRTVGCNQDGFVLVVGMMVMVVLTFIGIAATNTTIFEHLISANDKVAKDVFYEAEAAAYEGAQRLENEDDRDNLKAARTQHLWLMGASAKDDFIDDNTKWEDDDLTSGMTHDDSSVSIVAIDQGVLKGEEASSLKMTSPSVYGFQLLGHSKQNSSEKTIEIGYKKKY